MACFEAGRIAVLAPAGAILNSLCFVPDWLVTTDSMGLRFANELGAARYVIVRTFTGIYELKPEEVPGGAPIPHLSVEALERLPSSKLDQPSLVSSALRLANSRRKWEHPRRVAAAIREVRLSARDLHVGTGRCVHTMAR